ncbi:MAG: LamG-like jellyroll fold domain-containing protein, partial [Chthoniobacteraceae bacterium]
MPLRFLRICLPLALLLCGAARADVVVVFNEIMYHPAAANPAAEGALEWIELRNEMSVDIDMSGWAFTDGVSYVFPEGTIIPAHGYLVVAADPAALGFAGALGPWTGKLDNGGELLTLSNHDGRKMDSISYGTDGGWPSGSDGGGTSLAKRNRGYGSGDARSWRESTRVGGTLGADNFPEFQPPTVTTLVDANGSWIFRADGVDQGSAWTAPGASEVDWMTGNGTFTLGDLSLPEPASAGAALPAGPTTYYFRRRFQFNGQTAHTELNLRLLIDDGAAVYLNGTEIARANLPTGANSASPANNPRRSAPVWQEFAVPAALLQSGENLLAVEIHQAAALPSYPAAVVASGPTAYWRLDEATTAAGAAADLADVPGAPEQGGQNGTLQGFDAADLGAAGPRPTDVIGGQPLLGFDAENAAPLFRGNGSGGNDVALFPDGGVLNFAATGHKFTAEAWIKAGAVQEDGAPVFAKGNGGGGEQFALDIYFGHFRFYVRDAGTNAAIFQHPSLGPNGTWQHVAVTHDPVTNAMRMFVNGVDVGGTTPKSNLLNNSEDISVGARRTSTGPYDLNLAGSVDEVALYSRALSAAEIAQHYAAAFVAGPTGTDTEDAVFAAELIATETLPTESASTFVLNEVST